MKQGIKTEWELQQEKALDKSKIGWEIIVKNKPTLSDNLNAEVVTTFSSEDNDSNLDCVAHKLKLDLITAVKFGHTTPFEVVVKRILPSC